MLLDVWSGCGDAIGNVHSLVSVLEDDEERERSRAVDKKLAEERKREGAKWTELG